MNNFVRLDLKRNRGWPWPAESWGLSPVYGDDGWCHSCGTPLREQIGSLVLQTEGLTTVEGAWVPNWQFDLICLAEPLADQVADRFELRLLPIEWRGRMPTADAMLIVVPSTMEPWFDHRALTEALTTVHGSPGARCEDCDRWRSMPLASESLPAPQIRPEWEPLDVVASPEWFGDGWKSFREILVKRDLAELIVSASPDDFTLQEIA